MRRAGTPSLDGNGMTADDLGIHLKGHWPKIRSWLLGGTYEPQPVRQVGLPKASGGVRPLGVPTVFDRFTWDAMPEVCRETRAEASRLRATGSSLDALPIRP